MIITGAPVEMMPFEEVQYWNELTDIMEWGKTHVFSTLHICWGAQAGLYYHYGIDKEILPEKLFGVYENVLVNPKPMLLKGFDEIFYMPHSRHTTINRAQIKAHKNLEILAESDCCMSTISWPSRSIDLPFLLLLRLIPVSVRLLPEQRSRCRNPRIYRLR